MTRRWTHCIFGCLIVMALEFSAKICYAQSQPAEASAEPSARSDPKGANENPVNVNKADFSNWSTSTTQTSPSYDSATLGLHLFRDFVDDQRAIWTSPSHLSLADADWLLPLGVATGGMLATDTETSKHLSNSSTRLKHSKDVSNYGIGAMVAAGGGLYLWGHLVHDDHKRETGILAGEAAVNSLVATYAIKYAFGRERPLQPNPLDDYEGKFWQAGDSFPSEHAAAAWSIASVIAHEYPGPFTTFFAYGAASAISASRISAKQHFPTDVLVASALGWFVGQEVYRKHHDPTLGGGDWETYAESQDERGNGEGSGSVGSPYVELDSWVYPAIERLAALGYIHSEFLGMRPWTRLECAQLVEEAGDQIADQGSVSENVNRIYGSLQAEFRRDLDSIGVGGSERFVRLESLYTNTTGISGQPLNDSYHFGQTIVNNFGRPYQEGINSYDGFSGYGTAGRFTIYVRGEYQHAPSGPAFSENVRNTIAALDFNPVQPGNPIGSVDRFTLLDTYICANVANWDLSFGKQSLWWSPNDGSSFMFSDNAEPIYMFRASRIAPFTLPWIFHWLGPMKWDVFFGKLSGNEFPPRPLIHGEKISFKPTPNLELGFTRTAEMGGVGRPLTPAALFNSYVSFVSSGTCSNPSPGVPCTPKYGANNNPGKRTGGFDFSYRLPFVRNWISVYADSASDDDPSPLAAPRRAGIDPGLYLSHFPGLPKLDLRIEAGYTDIPTSVSNGGHFLYFDSFYHDLYTNKNNIIGSWIGREGMGFQGWSTYWFSARDSLQFGYRHAKVAKDFIPDGETVNDASAKFSWTFARDFSVSAGVQYEKWLAPILASAPQTNWTSSVDVTFWPESWRKSF
ncbi:MAG: capsule assembly Wzi family protein [Candidatus Acidiferrales bacterium]